MTPAQKATLKTAIQATPAANAFYVNGDLTGLADFLNTNVAPAFWVWRPDVSRADIYALPNDLPVSGAQTGFWNWTTYKNQAATEQNAWVQMFMGDQTNFAFDNVRAGVSAIFTGSAQATAQRDHVLAIGRRAASFAEKVLATGAGTTASPAVMSHTGPISSSELIGL